MHINVAMAINEMVFTTETQYLQFWFYVFAIKTG